MVYLLFYLYYHTKDTFVSGKMPIQLHFIFTLAPFYEKVLVNFYVLDMILIFMNSSL
jgi:hypothetical protein